MSRRNFLKQISLLMVASACAFKGGTMLNSKNYVIERERERESKYTPNPFVGQKSSGFLFSSPLPFNFKFIDELALINKKYKKCKITTLYASLPYNAEDVTGFEIGSRNLFPAIHNFNDFSQFIKYAQNKGFDFVYLINQPRPFFMEEFEQRIPRLEMLFQNLKKAGVKKVKVSNQQLLEALKNQNEFEVQASTAFEFSKMRQFENLLAIYPNIKHFNLAIDANRNIPLLKNLKKAFKDINFELMVDENCIYGCPVRRTHISCPAFAYPCRTFWGGDNEWKHITRSNVIYPWNLDYYASIGIKHFKFMGGAYGMRPNMRSVAYVRDFFEAVENGVSNLSFNELLGCIGFFPSNPEFPVTEELLSYFPDINHFIKNGGDCDIKCGVECNYCISCAEKLNKIAKIRCENR